MQLSRFAVECVWKGGRKAGLWSQQRGVGSGVGFAKGEEKNRREGRKETDEKLASVGLGE